MTLFLNQCKINIFKLNYFISDVYCPAAIFKGKISDRCDRKVLSTCMYECDTNYGKNQNVMSIRCQEEGYWNQTNNLCQG